MEWYIIALIAAVILAIHDIVSKKALNRQHAFSYLTISSIIYFVLTLPFIQFFDKNLSLTTLFLIYFGAVIYTVYSVLLAKSYRHMEISSVVPLKILNPIPLTIIAFLILGESISRLQLIGILLLLAGGFVLEFYGKSFKKIISNKYIIFVLISILLFGFIATIDKFVLRYTNVFTLLFLTTLFLSVHFLIIQFTLYKGLKDIQLGIRKNFWWIILATITALFADFSYYQALAVPGALVSLIVPILRLSSLFTVIIGGEIFHEKYLIRKIIACLIMVLGAILIVT